MFSAMSSRAVPPPTTTRSETPAGTKPPDGQDVEAHRQREQRWIQIMQAVPAAQARKNKKVRKLLWEGVPASVRYIVWAHLTDSKAKRTDNIYYRLTRRDRVAAAGSIERDLKRVFPDEAQLHDGSLLNVLQAYLTMVPDIHYSRGTKFYLVADGYDAH
jgi:TBC1 domain family member 10